MKNELAGFVMRSASGTVGLVESNTDRTAMMYVRQGGKLSRVIVPVASLNFIPPTKDEWRIILALYSALPQDVQNRAEMQQLRIYAERLRIVAK